MNWCWGISPWAAPSSYSSFNVGTDQKHLWMLCLVQRKSPVPQHLINWDIQINLALMPQGKADSGCTGKQLCSPLQEVLILPPICKASPSHTQVLHQPQVFHLMPDQAIIKLPYSKNTHSLINTVCESSLTYPSIGSEMEEIKPTITLHLFMPLLQQCTQPNALPGSLFSFGLMHRT